MPGANGWTAVSLAKSVSRAIGNLCNRPLRSLPTLAIVQDGGRRRSKHAVDKGVQFRKPSHTWLLVQHVPSPQGATRCLTLSPTPYTQANACIPTCAAGPSPQSCSSSAVCSAIAASNRRSRDKLRDTMASSSRSERSTCVHGKLYGRGGSHYARGKSKGLPSD